MAEIEKQTGYPLKLIAFDLFGVVFTEGHIVSGALMSLLPELRDNPGKTSVKHYYHLYTQGDISEADFWQGIGQADNTKLRNDFLNAFELDDALENVIKTLSKHYSLAVLSNLATDWADYLIDKYQLAHCFKPIIISGENRCIKPDKPIYEILIERSGIAPEQTLFIDDRLENLATAHQLGMRTVHYAREKDNFDYTADYCIHELSELLKLLAAVPIIGIAET